MSKRIIKKKEVKKTEYELYAEKYIAIQVDKLNRLTDELSKLEPHTESYAEVVMLINCVEEDLEIVTGRLNKVEKSEPKKPKTQLDMTQLAVATIGTVGTLLATSMVINNERDGNIMPQWSRDLTSKLLRK